MVCTSGRAAKPPSLMHVDDGLGALAGQAEARAAARPACSSGRPSGWTRTGAASCSLRRSVVNGEATQAARGAHHQGGLVRRAPCPSRIAARGCFASSKREGFTSVARMLAEASSTMTTLLPAQPRGEQEGRRQGDDQQGSEREQLQQQEQVALQLLEGRVRLQVLRRAPPEKDGGDDHVAPPELEQVEQDDDPGEGDQRRAAQRERGTAVAIT